MLYIPSTTLPTLYNPSTMLPTLYNATVYNSTTPLQRSTMPNNPLQPLYNTFYNTLQLLLQCFYNLKISLQHCYDQKTLPLQPLYNKASTKWLYNQTLCNNVVTT